MRSRNKYGSCIKTWNKQLDLSVCRCEISAIYLAPVYSSSDRWQCNRISVIYTGSAFRLLYIRSSLRSSQRWPIANKTDKWSTRSTRDKPLLKSFVSASDRYGQSYFRLLLLLLIVRIRIRNWKHSNWRK